MTVALSYFLTARLVSWAKHRENKEKLVEVRYEISSALDYSNAALAAAATAAAAATGAQGEDAAEEEMATTRLLYQATALAAMNFEPGSLRKPLGSQQVRPPWRL